MPYEDIEFYHETRYRGTLPLQLVRQLAALASRVLEADGRESIGVDENNRFVTARIARTDGMAIAAANRKVEGYLIEIDDPAAFRLKARRRVFAFEAGDLTAPADWRLENPRDPDIWYNPTVTDLMWRLDRRT